MVRCNPDATILYACRVTSRLAKLGEMDDDFCKFSFLACWVNWAFLPQMLSAPYVAQCSFTVVTLIVTQSSATTNHSSERSSQLALNNDRTVDRKRRFFYCSIRNSGLWAFSWYPFHFILKPDIARWECRYSRSSYVLVFWFSKVCTLLSSSLFRHWKHPIPHSRFRVDALPQLASST